MDPELTISYVLIIYHTRKVVSRVRGNFFCFETRDTFTNDKLMIIFFVTSFSSYNFYLKVLVCMRKEGTKWRY